MPPSPEFKQKTPTLSADDVSLYPPAAFGFMQEGLDYTVRKMHGPHSRKSDQSRHVSGQDLCEGLRELALAKWGRMARTVFRRWNITSTADFGRIVFAMIERQQMQKTDEDTPEDFKDVYDFKTVFEARYRIPSELTPS